MTLDTYTTFNFFVYRICRNLKELQFYQNKLRIAIVEVTCCYSLMHNCVHLSHMQATRNHFSHLIGNFLRRTCEREWLCNNFYLILVVRYTLKYVYECYCDLLILPVNSLSAVAFVS